MALRFTALDPSFIIVGNAPMYRVLFVDENTGLATDPDSVESLEIYIGGVLQRSFIPPDINSPSTGLYEVQDSVITEPGLLELRWTYIEATVTKQASATFEVVPSALGTGDQRIIDYVLQQLGDGVMFIGLPQGTLDGALRKAKLWYAQRHGQSKKTEFFLQDDIISYAVADDCYYVTNVYFEGLRSRVTEALGAFGIWGFTQLGLSNVPVEDLYGAGGAQGFYSSLVQSLQYAELGRRVLGGEPTWEWREHERLLYIFPIPKGGLRVIVEYTSTGVDTSNMLPHEETFLCDWALAEAKHALGLIRRKYSGFATAQGERSLDGDSLVAEAAEMKRELELQIQLYAPAGWIITG